MDAERSRRAAYRFDRFTLDPDRGALLGPDGTELTLRPKSFALLQLFVENAGRLLDRDAIMTAVWPDVFVSDDSITQCVRDIRRAFGDESQTLLRTVPRRGYVFAGKVSRVEPILPPTQEPAVAPAADVAVESLEGVPMLRPASPKGIEPVRFALSPERRHLTVLCCDFAGADKDAFDDPEDFVNAMRAYRERCAGAIAACGGHVASYVDDGVLAFFGYPRAREDAAERSVRAGLAIIAAIDSLKSGSGPALRARVGIATGLVVNDQVSGGTLEQVAVGKPLTVAAELQAMAKPGSVVIADSTRSLLGSLFDLEDLGEHALKGSPSVRTWQVIGDSTTESRFEALRGTSLTPLIGRAEELTLLLDRWEQAKEGDGQVVLLSGEPGIGKSRLLQALRERLADMPHILLGCYCSPHRLDSPLQPVIAHLERAANFARGDEPEQKLAKLEALLAQRDEDVARAAPLFASLLSIPAAGRYAPLDMSRQQQRERTLSTLVDQIERLAARQPVLLVWEDVHWADPTSLELLGLAIDRVQGLPVLAVVTFRPEFTPPWRGYTHVTGLTLNRLSRRRCGHLVAGVTGGKTLPDVVLDQIATKSDGMPLFAEELTKAVIESGLLREEDDRYELDGPLPPLAIPATLQDSLMARLDRLTPAKEVAQVAAVIGREFSHELLAAIVPRVEELDEALHQLMAAELVFRRGVTPQVTYSFKHALVRDAAHASLLKSRRRQLHARIAEVLEESFAPIVESEPDVLASHWAEAGAADKAAIYRMRAGQLALAHSATAEAVAQLTLGQQLLDTLPEGDGRHHAEIDLQIMLGAALSAAKGYAAPETTRAYARARELCGKLGEERRLVPALLGLWGSYNARDALGAARDVAEQLLRLAEQKQELTARILGHRALGSTLFGLGEFTAARLHLETLLTIEHPSDPLAFVRLPFDPYVSGRGWLGLTLAVLGYPEQGLAQSDAALAEAERLNQHNTTAIVLGLRCSLGQFLDEPRDVTKHASALRALAAEQGYAYWVGLSTCLHGWALARAGALMAGISEMRRGLTAYKTTGAQAYVPYNLARLADMCRLARDMHEARALLDEALNQVETTGARYCEAELLCIDGEIKLAMSPADKTGAEESFHRAIELARLQQAKTVELRAATCLAQLWSAQGERAKARELLAPIYGWFTEGLATVCLIEAKRLLDELKA
jgi:class 3 adenylate cyclase/predicted ATPase